MFFSDVSLGKEITMKKIVVVMAVLIFTFSDIVAQEKGTGIGITLVEATGISAKYWLDTDVALDGILAYSLLGNSGITICADYVYHLTPLHFRGKKFVPYYGFGGHLSLGEGTSKGLGVRGVLGTTWILTRYPADIFLEAAPIFVLLPSTKISLDVSLGARWFFQ